MASLGRNAWSCVLQAGDALHPELRRNPAEDLAIAAWGNRQLGKGPPTCTHMSTA